MNPVYLFDLASRHVSWDSFRQTVVTSNIANANTPGYAAQDVKPFSDIMDGLGAGLEMAVTSPAHLVPDDPAGAAGDTVNSTPFEVSQSGNSVSIDQEMIKADDINRSMSLDLSVERAFQRMLLDSVKGAGS